MSQRDPGVTSKRSLSRFRGEDLPRATVPDTIPRLAPSHPGETESRRRLCTATPRKSLSQVLSAKSYGIVGKSSRKDQRTTQGSVQITALVRAWEEAQSIQRCDDALAPRKASCAVLQKNGIRDKHALPT
jgi:hypothetical protein